MPAKSPAPGGADALLRVIRAQHRGEAVGITSVCSANEFVLRAALSLAKRRSYPLLIESTCNQVNQDGGYTGLTPAEFRQRLMELALEADYPAELLILGGDHLGPHVWRNLPADQAMARARRLVHDYIEAGYRKIHLDTSMLCADDDRQQPLPIGVSAARAAQLAQVAEAACDPAQDPRHLPHYVIGTEVPIPGGAEAGDHSLQVSTPETVAEVIAVTQAAFLKLGLAEAWQRVLAVVVQPGVEFTDGEISHYDAQAASGLARWIENHPGLVYEVHSTDYQRRRGLRELVRDHFAILKVGPALTYAFRQTLLALARIEEQWDMPGMSPSYLEAALEAAMRANPDHWQGYYVFDPAQPGLARRDGFSDRSRYYWSVPAVTAAVERLLANLSRRPIPQSLLHEHLPELHAQLPDDSLLSQPTALIAAGIQQVLEDYDFACGRIES